MAGLWCRLQSDHAAGIDETAQGPRCRGAGTQPRTVRPSAVEPQQDLHTLSRWALSRLPMLPVRHGTSIDGCTDRKGYAGQGSPSCAGAVSSSTSSPASLGPSSQARRSCSCSLSGKVQASRVQARQMCHSSTCAQPARQSSPSCAGEVPSSTLGPAPLGPSSQARRSCSCSRSGEGQAMTACCSRMRSCCSPAAEPDEPCVQVTVTQGGRSW